MSLRHPTLDIRYDMNTGEFEIDSDLNPGERYNLIETFLKSQVGAGEDKSEAEVREIYNIRLELFPETNIIEVSSNTENKGLREGILVDVLRNLEQ